jgi:DNA-binding LacI/PurR family transcriptional regulator
MPRTKTGSKVRDSATPPPDRPVSLKTLAAHLDLSPTTISLVLNNAPAAKAIPQETQERIVAAAREFAYRPNPIARSLRSQRTFTLGVFVPELSEGYSALVLSGVEDFLLGADYFYFTATHRHKAERIDEYTRLFTERCVEGLVYVDTPLAAAPGLPTVIVSGHQSLKGVTNIVLNHEKAAMLAIEHLVGLGHRQIAVIKGQDFSSDTEVRWQSIRAAAAKFGVPIRQRLVVSLVGDTPSPEPGYIAGTKLLATGEPFSAVFAFNDISAIGVIRTLREAGLRVPEDVSVVGFDDALGAAFHNPPLTTIRQPLHRMGSLAAETVLRRIAAGPAAPVERELTVEPELVIRQSTAVAPAESRRASAPRGRRVLAVR